MRLGGKVLLGGALVSVGLAAFAQNANPPGLSINLDLSSGLEFSDNSEATTDLLLRFDSQTRNQQLSFSIGTGIIRPIGSSSSGSSLDRPRASINYMRDNGMLQFTTSASYSINELKGRVSFTDPNDPTVSSFIDDPGEVENYRFSAGVVYGANNPFGVDISGSYSERNFINTLDPALEDSKRHRVDVSLRFDASPVLSIFPTYSYEVIEDEDAVNTKETTQRAGLRFRYLASSVVTVTGGVRSAEIETETDGGGGRVVATNSDLDFNLGAVVDRPNGSASVDFARDLRSTGPLDTVTVGRVMTLANGSDLSFSVGIASFGSGETAGIGRIALAYPVPTGQINLSARQSAVVGADMEEAVSSRFSAGYTHDLTSTSTLRLSANWASFDVVTPAGGTDRTSSDISLEYRRQLTRDWNLRAGVEHRVSKQSGSARDTDDIVYINLSRSFSLLR